MRFPLGIFLISLFYVVARSQDAQALVSYKDDTGSIHYVDSKAEVPEKYRKHAPSGNLSATAAATTPTPIATPPSPSPTAISVSASVKPSSNTNAGADNANASDALVTRAETKIAAGDHTGAVKDLNKAVLADPKNSHAYMLLGNESKLEGDHALGEAKKKPYLAAFGSYDRAISLDRRNTDALYGMAELYRYTNDYEEAVIYYRATLELSPNYPGAKAHLSESEAIIKAKTERQKK